MANGVDVATLTIRIDASQVQAAIAQLKGLGAESVRVQGAAVGATAGMGRLNGAMLQLARQATGTSPIVARLGGALGQFALSGPVMTAALLGIAALGAAWNRWRDNAKEAREEAEKLLAVLDDLAAKSGPGAVPGAVAFSQFELDRLTAERGRLEARNRTFGQNDYRDEKILELAFQAAAMRSRAGAGLNSMNVSGVFDSVGAPIDNRQSNFNAERARETREAREMMRGLIDEQRDLLAAWRGQYGNIGNANRLVFDGRNGYQGSNAGIVNIAGAQQNLANMRGTGTARSGLSPTELGTNLVGGAASGGAGGLFSTMMSMAGPQGAILSGVTSIVSGLFTAGQQARAAQRQWDMALQGFEDMWDDLNPQQQTDRAFQRSFGMTPAEAQARVQEYSGLRGQSRTLIQGTIDWLNEALASYARQSAQAAEVTNETAEAEKRLHDARRNVLQALNSPAGLNLAGYGYRAEAAGGMTVNGDFIVNVDGSKGDPKAVADAVFAEGRRRLRNGGPSPYAEIAR